MHGLVACVSAGRGGEVRPERACPCGRVWVGVIACVRGEHAGEFVDPRPCLRVHLCQCPWRARCAAHGCCAVTASGGARRAKCTTGCSSGSLQPSRNSSFSALHGWAADSITPGIQVHRSCGGVTLPWSCWAVSPHHVRRSVHSFVHSCSTSHATPAAGRRAAPNFSQVEWLVAPR